MVGGTGTYWGAVGWSPLSLFASATGATPVAAGIDRTFAGSIICTFDLGASDVMICGISEGSTCRFAVRRGKRVRQRI